MYVDYIPLHVFTINETNARIKKYVETSINIDVTPLLGC